MQVYDINADSSNAPTSIKTLLSGGKWGGLLGAAANITYSFSKNGLNYSYANQSSLAANATEMSADQKAGASLALANFASIANLSFTQITDTASNSGDIRFANSTSGTAEAWEPYGHPSAGDVFFGASGVQPLTNGYDYQTMLHEIGHALGLKHISSDPAIAGTVQDQLKYSVMSYRSYQGAGVGYSNSFYPTTLMLNDIQAIQYLYGINTTYKSGDDTYSWDSDSSVFETIYDAGGNDTIDASNQLQAVKINLNSGEWSEIGKSFNRGDGNTVRDTLTIAYSSVIENAKGSAFNDILIGNSADNLLQGNAGNDSLEGGAGNDSLRGGLGNDLLNGGDGLDYADYVEMTTSININLNLTTAQATGSGGSDTIINIENVRGGSANDNLKGNALNNIFDGQAGNDSLFGNAGDDFLTGGAGNDILNGGLGNDNISGGDGNDWADYFDSTSAVNVDLRIATQQNTVGAGIDIFYNIENIRGSNGNDTLNGSAYANALVGQTGNDFMVGNGGNDTLYAGLGNDTLFGGTDNDTYQFNLGDNQDILTDNDATIGNSDVLAFQSGILNNQLWFTQVGNDLLVSIIGTSDKVTIKSWYASSNNIVESITAGGKALDSSNVNALVSAMSAFSAPPMGQTSLSNAYQTALNPVIAANWA